jgi:hypothetical protein
MSIKGLIGAFFLGLGGAITFWLLDFIYYINHNGFGPRYEVVLEAGFFGFLLLGIGIWLIVESGKLTKS